MDAGEPSAMSVVMDASAVLAILFGERGADVAAASARGARLSTVNLTEILEKIARRTDTCDAVLPTLAELKIDIVPFDHHQARLAADLKLRVGKNDSFADRACLSLALASALPVVSADRAWADLDIGVDIRMIR